MNEPNSDSERVLSQVAARCDELVLTMMTYDGQPPPVVVTEQVALTMAGQLSGIMLCERMTPGELAAHKRFLADAISMHRNGGVAK